MKVARQLLTALEELGVRYLFGLPGSTEAPLLDALVEPGRAEYILSLHENIAVAMADGYARGSGGPGIVNLHTSVGTANGLSQLYNAHRDHSPVVVLAGHKETALFNRGGFCIVDDLPGMARQVTKWSGEVRRPEQAVDDLYRAIKIALTPPRGPVFLSLPEDVLAVDIDSPVPASAGRLPEIAARPTVAALTAAADLLARAERPLIIAGDGVTHSGALDTLAALAADIGAVVVREPRIGAACWNFPTDHPHFCGEYSPQHPAVQEADCLFAVGCRVFLEFVMPGGPQVPAGVPLIHLHDDPLEIARNYAVAAALTGAVASALAELRTLLPAARNGTGAAPRNSNGTGAAGAWVAAHRERHLGAMAQELRAQSGGQPMRASEAVATLAAGLPGDAILVDEGIRSGVPLVRHYPFRHADTYHHTSGGALGWGLPAALGLQMAHPDRRVVAYVGDGSALFTIQALWTAAHYRLPVLFVIVNNRAYLAVKEAIHRYGGIGAGSGRYPASTLGDPAPDFVRLAEGCGVPALRAGDASALRAALRTALAATGPYLLEVLIAEEPL